MQTRSSISKVSKAINTARRTYKSKMGTDVTSGVASVMASVMPYVEAIVPSEKSNNVQPLSPVVSSVTSPVVSSAASPLPYIIYQTEGVYRPICVVQLKNPGTWITPNISYYRSSGQSNDRFQQKFSNTWLPCATILEDRATIGGKDLEKGFVFKMSTFLEYAVLKDWGCKFLNTYFINKYAVNFPKYVEDILKTTSNEKNPNLDLLKELQTKNNMTRIEVYEIYKKLLEEYHEIHEFISSYFLHDWQLAISANAGGGYWQHNTDFLNYVLANTQMEKFILPNFDIQEQTTAASMETDNLDEVVQFLKINKCFPSVELLNDAANNYRKQANSRCSDIVNNKYFNVEQGLNQLYRANNYRKQAAASERVLSVVKGGSKKKRKSGGRRKKRTSHKKK